MPYQVYRVLNLTNNKVYIGITSKTYKKRFRDHLKEVHSGSTFIFHNAIRKYGPESFETSLLETCQNPDHLKEREKHWIEVFDSTNREKGYNMTSGGDGTFGRPHGEQTKLLIGEKRSRKVILTHQLTGEVLEFKNAIPVYAFLGLPKGTFSVHKWKAEKAGIPHQEGEWVIQVIQKPRETKPERPRELILAHMDTIREGSAKWRKEHPQEMREAMMAGRLKYAKPVDQLTMDGEYIQTFPSAGYAADAVKLPGNSPAIVRGNIRNACRTKGTSAKGFKWRWSTNTTTDFIAQTSVRAVVGE